MFDRIPLNAPEFRQIAASLHEYDPKSVIPQVGALLTIPELQANTIRLETLVHLAVAYCDGNEIVPAAQIGKWLNNYLENSKIANREDPPEDVFIGNVGTPQGNRRIFNGISHSNDYFVQVVIDILADPKTPRECRDLLVPVSALMALSERVAERLGLQRWHCEESIPWGTIELPSATQLIDRARAITFTAEEFRVLGIRRDILEPFVFHGDDKSGLTTESTANSTLERCPIIDLGGDLILTLPHAVSPAIRRFVVSKLRELGHLVSFSKELANRQAGEVAGDGLRELRGKIESLELPHPDGIIPQLHTWLLRYDIDKFIHVVLLHDRLNQLDEQGISSFMEYSDAERVGLGNYLYKVSKLCMNLTGFEEGMTLLVIGGVGRGFAASLGECPDQWRLSVIQLPDLLTLASDVGRSVSRYLKCMKFKDWAEKNGVYFSSIPNGDFSLYCSWRRQEYRLVPRNFALIPETTVVYSDFDLPIRREVRCIADRHVLQTTDSAHIPVVRFSVDTHFESMRNRPIYVSIAHLRASVLAGAAETRSSAYWLLADPPKDNEKVRRFLHLVWNGFLELYARLVIEIESLYPEARVGAAEIRLDFNDLIVPEGYVEFRTTGTVDKPLVAVNLKQRTAIIKFPSDFFVHFLQPENAGERAVFISIAEGLIKLCEEATGNVEESVLDYLVHRVVGDSGMRILHAFSIDPFHRLLDRHVREPVFLANEDYTFRRLGLSEGCVSNASGTRIATKAECNGFLHRVVEKIWNRLRQRLRQFERASVIRNTLEVCEAAYHDREHWNRSAKAMLALYALTDDVHAIARRRESDRTNVSIAARTIIEMGICECPASCGRLLSRWALDELLSEAALLIEVATHSDAIQYGMTQPKIELHANGEYDIDRSFHQDVVEPFVTAYHHEKLENAASEYFDLYCSRPDREKKRINEVFSSDFIDAFQYEFGLTPEDVRRGFAALMELASEYDAVLVETTLGHLKAKLTSDRGLTPDRSEHFIRTFAIFHRPKWETPPNGFRKNDLYPWRHNRRLSASVKPILVFGEKDEDKVIFGAGTLANGCIHLLDRSEQGRLPQEFFTSREMKEYIGKVNDARGHAFARWVADQMRERKWQAKTEVKMTELGAPADLGDVDVLAWKSDGTIRLIECKRLTFARTIAEIANICKRFKGEAKDELAKHLRRVEWIRRNPQRLRDIVGFRPDPNLIDHRLVTNTQVPLKYMESLPIEPYKIVVWNEWANSES